MGMFDLSGKIAIITGGSRGIGLGIAKGLGGAGATIIIANRKAAEGQKAVDSLKKEGLKTVVIPVDVSVKSSVDALVAKVIKDFGKIDILVNDAGVIVRKPAVEILEEDWDTVIDTNLKGTFLVCQAVGREMIKRKWGRIINISSNIVQRLQPDRVPYAVSKAGINHLTKALALEWGKFNINVNAIAPTVTITDINRKFYLEEHRDQLEEWIKFTAKGRVASPEDYVGAAIFLSSDASDYVTGQILYVEGGSAL